MPTPVSHTATCTIVSDLVAAMPTLPLSRVNFTALERRLDIIGDSVYWLYANLCDLTRPTARVPGRDRPDARRVCACTAGLYCRLCRTLSARQDVGRQGTPTPGRRRRQRRFAAQGRQAVLPPRLPEDQSAANDARFAIRAESTPAQRLDASLAPRPATRLRRSRRGAGTRCEPGRQPPPCTGRRSRCGHRRHGAPAPTSNQCRAAQGAVQRQEENAYGQAPRADQGPYDSSGLFGTDGGWQNARQESRRCDTDGLSHQRDAGEGDGFSGL